MRRWSGSIVCAALVAGVVVPSGAAAQSTPTEPPARQVTAGWKDGFVLRSEDDANRLQLGLLGQMDGRFVVGDPHPAVIDSFVIRKLRPTVSGRVANYFDFRVVPDFGGGTAVLQDAFVDIRFSHAFRVRTGKDKTPIGMEWLQGDASVLFPERSLASSLVPYRDVGVQVVGDAWGGALSYAGGLFNGVPDSASSTSDTDTNGGKDLAGRFMLRPFKSGATPKGRLAGLGVALGGSRGRETGALPSFKTAAGQTYFSYNHAASADGLRTRITPSVFYYYKAFGGFAEYVRSAQAVTSGGDRHEIANTAWEVTGSIVLTGEAASDRVVKPTRSFDPAHGDWGALQLLGRYAELRVDPRAFVTGLAAAGASRQARAFAIGADWYPATAIKYYVVFETTVFEGDPAAPRHTERAIVFRSQIAF